MDNYEITEGMRKRITWLDLARGMGIILMYAGHMPNLFPQIIRDWIFSFHMPLFYFISGFLFKMDSPRKKLKRTIRSLLVPYIVYSALFILLDAMLYQDFGKLSESFYRFCKGQGGSDILWFFCSLFLVENIYNLLHYIFRNKRSVVLMSVVVASALIGYVMTLFGIATWFKLSVSIGALLFFGTGECICQVDLVCKAGTLKPVMWGSIALVLFLIMEGLNLPMIDINGLEMGFLPLSFPCAVCGCMLILTLSYRLDGRWAVPIRYIGRYSLYFYPLGSYLPVRIMESGVHYLGISASLIWKLLSKVLGYSMTVGIVEIDKSFHNKRTDQLYEEKNPGTEKVLGK